MVVLDKNGSKNVTYKQMVIWMVSLFLGLLSTAVIVASTIRSVDQEIANERELSNHAAHNEIKLLQKKTSEQLAELLQIVAVSNESQTQKHKRIDEILRENQEKDKTLSQRITELQKRIENGI